MNTVEAMRNRRDQAEAVAGIRKGLAQAGAGQGTEAAPFFDRLAQAK